MGDGENENGAHELAARMGTQFFRVRTSPGATEAMLRPFGHEGEPSEGSLYIGRGEAVRKALVRIGGLFSALLVIPSPGTEDV
jgi:hypothetical protein